MLAASPPKMISGENFRTKATLESSISRLSFESEARKRGRRKTGYPRTAFSRQSPRNANHQPARMRLVAGQMCVGGWGGQIMGLEKNKAVGAVYR
jgi:hypothetical protein